MTKINQDYSAHTAPPGHVTFSVLDHACNGHSMSVASKAYSGIVRSLKSVISDLNQVNVFEGAIEIIRRSVVRAGDDFQCEDDELLFACISALLKHPDKRIRKTITASIRGHLKKEGGAHVVLLLPPTGPAAWMVGAPGGTSH